MFRAESDPTQHRGYEAMLRRTSARFSSRRGRERFHQVMLRLKKKSYADLFTSVFRDKDRSWVLLLLNAKKWCLKSLVGDLLGRP